MQSLFLQIEIKLLQGTKTNNYEREKDVCTF
jgi:hypothetical protein